MALPRTLRPIAARNRLPLDQQYFTRVGELPNLWEGGPKDDARNFGFPPAPKWVPGELTSRLAYSNQSMHQDTQTTPKSSVMA